MENDDYSILSIPLPVDDQAGIMSAVASCEALSYGISDKIRTAEERIASLEHSYTVKWMSSMVSSPGDKVAISEARAKSATADIANEIAVLAAEVKYLKHVGKIIETRCSVGQSILSNYTAQIKAGIGSG